MTSFKFKGALAALSLTLFAGAAMAQAPSPGAAAWRARAHEMMEQHKAQMAHDLHTILRIRPDQESAFQAFIGSMAPPPRGEHEHKDHAAMGTMTTPQRLDRMLAKMDEHTARMRQHIQATKTFYAALSPEQQQVFDAFMRAHHHGHGGGHGHWGGGHGPMGEGPPPPPGE
jgi:hypothetical protein